LEIISIGLFADLGSYCMFQGQERGRLSTFGFEVSYQSHIWENVYISWND